MKKVIFSLQLLSMAFALSFFSAPAFADDDDVQLVQVADNDVNCEDLREKAGKLCNSLHPGNHRAFNRCFKKELDPRCK